MRELEQAVRRILLTGIYFQESSRTHREEQTLLDSMRAGELTAAELLGIYSALLYQRFGTYAEVAKRTGLDPRTSRKYVEAASIRKKD